jgi:hypothetical protein
MDRVKAKWEKIGGGLLRFKGQTYRRGDCFEAYEDEISKGMRNVVRLIGPVEEKKKPTSKLVRKVKPKDSKQTETAETEKEPKAEEPEETPKFEIRRKGGWYHIYNVETNKRMNSAALRKQEAEEFLEELQS